MQMPELDIKIVSLVSPQSIWVVERNKDNDGLIKILSFFERHDLKEYDDNFNFTQEIVAIYDCGKWYRALILEQFETVYTCWLIDYGKLVYTEHIFKLPEDIAKIERIVKRVCLNNLVYKSNSLGYDSQGNPVVSNSCSFVVTPIARDLTYKFLQAHKENLTVRYVNSEHGILYGDIYVKHQKLSLSNHLIQNKVMILNPTAFNEFKTSFDRIEHYPKGSNLVKQKNSMIQNELNKILKEHVVRDLSNDVSLVTSRKARSSAESDTSTSHNESFEQAKVEEVSDEQYMQFRLKVLERYRRMKVQKQAEAVESEAETSRSLTPVSRPLQLRRSHLSDNEGYETSDTEPKSFLNKNSELLKDTKKPIIYPSGANLSLLSKPRPNLTSKSNSSTSDTDRVNTPRPADIRKMLPKACTCKTCEHWNEAQWQSKLPTFQAKNQPFTAQRPAALIKHDSQVPNLHSLKFSNLSKIQKQSAVKVLLHYLSPLTACQNLSDSNFNPTIINNLMSLGYQSSKRGQSYAWPAIMRNENLLHIDGPEKGKTMAYLPAICSFLLENDRCQKLSKHSGPIAVLLCPTSMKAEEVYDLSKKVLGKSAIKVALVTYPLTGLLNAQTDLLITIPELLIHILKEKMVNLKRMMHLVFEDLDEIFQNNNKIVEEILIASQSMLDNRVVPKSVQFVATARHWNKELGKVLKCLNRTAVVCIGDFLEAAIYAKTQFSMKVMLGNDQLAETKRVLKSCFNTEKTILFCEEKQVEELKTSLMFEGIESISISEEQSKEDIAFFEERWASQPSGEYKLLICSDSVFKTMLTVTSADTIIHFSLPKYWSDFKKRHLALLENLKSPLNEPSNTKSIVLCNESSEKQLEKFLKVLPQLELALPEHFVEWNKEKTRFKEMKKIQDQIPLCNNLKLFGSCRSNCALRHIINENDIDQNLPISGEVKFIVQEAIDATQFYVKLLEHTDQFGNIKRFKEIDFSDYDQVPVDSSEVEKNGLYLVSFNSKLARCVVKTIKETGYEVRLVDLGKNIEVMSDNLYKAEDLAQVPFGSVEVVLANLLPPFGDQSFAAKAFYRIQRLLIEETIFSGEVKLQLAGTLWISNVVEKVELDGVVLPKFQLSKRIVQLGIAVNDVSQLEKLYRLCKDCGVSFSVHEKQAVKVTVSQVKPHWAFLDQEKPNLVTFCAAVSPEEVYVRLDKFSSQLSILQKQLQEVGKKLGAKKLKDIQVGKCYLGYYEEYCRVLVLEEQGDKALCFFVDHGDELILNKTDLRFLDNAYINKLPFQTIRVALKGLKPVEDSWDDEATDLLYQYSLEPNSDYFRALYIKTCEKIKGKIKGQKGYSVLMKDGFGEKNVLINKLLIDCGLALCSEPIEDFDLAKEEIEVINVENEVFDEDFGEFSVSEDDENLFEVFGEVDALVESLKSAFPQLAGLSDDVINEETKELPKIEAAPEVDHCSPEVLWSQTPNSVKLLIKVVDCKKYKIEVEGKHFTFETLDLEKPYKLDMVLFDDVEKMDHKTGGLEIKVVLKKKVEEEWPKLYESKKKLRNIKFDVSEVQVEETERKFLTLDIEDETDSDSDFILEVSDIDSEFEKEMQTDSDS